MQERNNERQTRSGGEDARECQPKKRKGEIDMTTMKHYAKKLSAYLRNSKAVSAMEYAILVGVIAVALGAALATFGTNITTAIEKVGSNVVAEHATKGSSPAPTP